MSFPHRPPAEYRPVSLNEQDDDDDNDGSEQRRNHNNGYSNNNNDDNGHHHHHHHRQQQLLQEQDLGLEMLGQSAERLGQMSMQISEELGFQNKILTEMDQDLDEAYDNLDMVTRKTQDFIKASGGTKNLVIILALVLVIVILVLLILYV
jgi:SNARE domain